MSSMSTDKENIVVAGAAEADHLDAAPADAEKEVQKSNKKTETAKTASKKADKEEAKTARKSGAKKPAAKKTDKPEVKPDVFIEYQGRQTQQAAIVESVKAAFVSSGHRASSIKSLSIYIKPEEFKAYYVINDGKYTGDVNLF